MTMDEIPGEPGGSGAPDGAGTMDGVAGPAEAVYTATFTFRPGAYDDEFHRRDAAIAAMARALPGYLGEEAWENPATGLVSNVYYWASLASLQALVDDPSHREAKQRQARWLEGYHIVIARVIGSHGDGRIAHPLVGQGAG